MVRIVHFMRDRRPLAFSIERLYEDVRAAMPADCHVLEWRCRNPSKGFWPRLVDAWSARKYQHDVNHVTGDTHYLTYFLDSRRTVLTIHDLVLLERSRGLRRLVFWFFWYWLPVRRCRMVVTVSACTRDALLAAVKCDPAKVVVINNPVSAEFRPALAPFDTSCPRILQVGTGPNKNFLRVVEALRGLSCKLIVIGPLSDEFLALLVDRGISYESHVGLSRADVVAQYVKADIVIFASTYEGFGLPIIEANAVGRPVITSRLSPMLEVAGDAAAFVDPRNVAEIRAAVIRLVDDPGYRERLVSAGFKNARRFRVTAVAEQYAGVYRSLSAASIVDNLSDNGSP